MDTSLQVLDWTALALPVLVLAGGIGIAVRNRRVNPKATSLALAGLIGVIVSDGLTVVLNLLLVPHQPAIWESGLLFLREAARSVLDLVEVASWVLVLAALFIRRPATPTPLPRDSAGTV